MKKLTLSVLALLAMGSVTIANANNGVYVGIGYTGTSIDIDGFNNGGLALDTSSGFVVQSGFKMNDYFAVEARYWNGDNNLDAWGLYVKPMYPVNYSLNVYGIVGYGNASTAPSEYNNISLDDASLQWGLGAEYAITESFSVFIDYVELYNDQIINLDWSLDALNLGVTYQF